MLLWLDLETTGLDPVKGKILEIAVVVTDDHLEEKWHGSWVVHQQSLVVSPLMSDFVRNMHTDNKLLQEVYGEHAVFLSAAEEQLILLVSKWFAAGEKPILCGNSIHFDRAWLKVHMPRFEALLHYRMGDASGTYELAKRVAGLNLAKPEAAHRALDDARASIKLAKQVFTYDAPQPGLTISSLQARAYSTAKSKGFWDMTRVLEGPDHLALISQKLALVHSEVSEALEALRHVDQGKNNFGEELADVVIRVADLAEFVGVDLSREVVAKLIKNADRPNKHSKKF
jgi:oligoribonuclease